MAGHIEEAGLGRAEPIMHAYDTRTKQAITRVLQGMPTATGCAIVRVLEDAWEDAEDNWAALFNVAADNPWGKPSSHIGHVH